MITLERVRLVNWHNFKDDVIEIGNRCLLAGDNGSGKSTIIDALQYVMAANLRMAKFNSAAEERKGGGRDLMGYVRCKLGSEATEYRRGDTIAHVMLEWSGPEPNTGFACGVCVEAYKDNHHNEHFWTGTDISIREITIRSDNNESLVFRRFKDSFESANEQKVIFFESKENYTRDITNKLGVFRRHQKVNSYLDTLTRSIGFKPLASIDQFVCDYILEENPVSIQDMKQNLENYKEADRQARGAIAKIGSLKKICAKAVEWKNYDGLILKQEYLKLRIELENEKNEKEAISSKHTETQNHLETTERRIVLLNQKLFDTEHELMAVVQSLAINDAHRLFEEIRTRIERIQLDLDRENENANRYRDIKSQCEILLNRKLGKNFDEENAALAETANSYRDEKYAACQKRETAGEQLRETRSELTDLEQGRPRYPNAPQELMAALSQAGIEAHILAEAAEITDPAWADAVEGWLNTRRFAVLVNPDDFQRALEVYDRLPRSVAGAFLPNIEKMRNVSARTGSLAEIVKAEAYARIYINYVLGKVMRADLASLKEYDSAVTKECMTYKGHTASRIGEEVYRRRYLGRAAQEERRKFLVSEKDRLEIELAAAEREERQATEHEDCCERVIRFLPKLENLFPSVENSEALCKDLIQAKTELAAIDTRSFIELEERRKEIEKQLFLLKEDNNRLQNERGDLNRTLSTCKDELEISSRRQDEKEDRIKSFGSDHPLMIGGCEEYAEERFLKASIAELTNTYETTLKRFKTTTETLKKEYNALVREYENVFNQFLDTDPADNAEAETLLKRLETSELPEYREKIAKAYQDAEKEFKDHFISRLNEHIEEARDSFEEINDILRTLHFGRDQYRFHLEELNERKGQIEVIRNAAKIPVADDGLFSQIIDPSEKKAAQDLFDSILNAPLDSEELKRICDYRTYFHYDIIITETDTKDENDNPVKLLLSRVLKEKSGGESQTPYYVAIAASFYRFYKARPAHTVRLVIFDEAFYRMDDERIGKILAFYNELNLQIITSVPPEKIEAIAPYMDRINVISRFGDAVKVRDCHIDATDLSDIEIGTA
ncbi:MAG: hypothetical protein LBH97_05940 [Treponema sp.]|nr:hypothetical protein [Treponema sp.]